MRNKLICVPAAILWALLTLFAWFGPAQELSESERRPLAQPPELSVKTLLNGSFMDSFEEYTLDQFPLRDSFRRMKALFHTYAMGQLDTNGIYIHDGYAAKMEAAISQTSLNHALSRLNHLYEKYLTGSKVYFAVVPDKNFYLAEEAGRLSMDYDRFFEILRQGTPWAEHIDLADALCLEDYYRTDTHWRQEKLLTAAGVIGEKMGIEMPAVTDYQKVLVPRPFYGVYYGQSALPMEAEEMYVMESPLLQSCRVYDHETGKYTAIYDMSKLESRDLYDVYLSGAKALLTIENPQGTPVKELIVFRDSFGSSMIPLLVGDYSKITVADIRYISSDLLENFVSFQGQDVLMLYSTLILNSSSAMK